MSEYDEAAERERLKTAKLEVRTVVEAAAGLAVGWFQSKGLLPLTPRQRVELAVAAELGTVQVVDKPATIALCEVQLAAVDRLMDELKKLKLKWTARLEQLQRGEQ